MALSIYPHSYTYIYVRSYMYSYTLEIGQSVNMTDMR